MSARHLVVGLDGADLDLIRRFGPSELPVLHEHMAAGVYAPLQSVQPPATLPNWMTFLTGTDPGVHGVFDFTLRQGYRLEFAAGTIREVPTIGARLDALGRSVAMLGFPGTWPPERLQHGVFMSGWDSPVAFEADASFVWPASFHRELQHRFGPLRFDDVNEFDADRPDWHRSLPGLLEARIERKLRLFRWVLDRKPWDLFAAYFGESDTGGHYLWSLSDPASPRHPRGTSAAEQQGLLRVYRALDEALGSLTEAAGPGVELTVVSDHGFGGSSDKVVYLNRVLADAGLLTFRPKRWRDRIAVVAKELALTRLPPAVRQRAFAFGKKRLAGELEAQVRFGGIDMSRTQAFSDELNYFPAVHLNLRGRDPEGVVTDAERASVIAEIRAALYALEDPWSGGPVVRAVHRREDLFEGPFRDRAPDLVVELHLDGDYSYNLQPSATAPHGIGAFRKLAPEEYLGRKGRSLPGSHRSHGIFIARGPKVAPRGEVEAAMADATATLLHRMEVEVPPQFAGRVLWETLAGRSTSNGFASLPPVVPAPRRRGRESLVEERLRALGYVE
ncbi:MAG: alkaline phosphatase family protein [Myxococcota bacterium]